MKEDIDTKIVRLLLLLDKATEEMLSYEDKSTFSYFNTSEYLGLFIQEIVNKSRNGKLEEFSKLWYVFAPTGVWDDFGGS